MVTVYSFLYALSAESAGPNLSLFENTETRILAYAILSSLARS
jgi:hypothetical protein